MITRKICPNCGSEDVFMISGGITGTWKCKNCGHTGAVFEKEIIGSDQESNKKNVGGKK
jgi:ribosomal protein L37AE/L43A